MLRKLSHDSVKYKSCCSILISSKRWRMDCSCESQSWRCDRQRLARLQYSRHQPSQIFIRRIIRSVTLRWSESKWFVSVFPISYILVTCSTKIHVLCTRTYRCCMRPWSHSIRIMFTLRIFINTFDSCHFCGSSTRFDENLNNNPILCGLMKFTR